MLYVQAHYIQSTWSKALSHMTLWPIDITHWPEYDQFLFWFTIPHYKPNNTCKMLAIPKTSLLLLLSCNSSKCYHTQLSFTCFLLQYIITSKHVILQKASSTELYSLLLRQSDALNLSMSTVAIFKNINWTFPMIWPDDPEETWIIWPGYVDWPDPISLLLQSIFDCLSKNLNFQI